MQLSDKKEQFSIAYIQAMAAQVGLNPSIDAVDNDSVDLTLKGKGFKGGLLRNPQIELQLKCTSQDFVNNGVIKFPLSVKNYNDLRGEDLTSPRYLAVLLVPRNSSEWVTVNDLGLSIYNNCYWASLRYLPETNNSKKIIVDIPMSQRVTPDSLHTLLEKASKGEFQ